MSLQALERLSQWISKASSGELPAALTGLAALQTLMAGRLLELSRAAIATEGTQPQPADEDDKH